MYNVWKRMLVSVRNFSETPSLQMLMDTLCVIVAETTSPDEYSTQGWMDPLLVGFKSLGKTSDTTESRQSMIKQIKTRKRLTTNVVFFP